MGNINASYLLKQGQFLKLSTKFQILKYDTDRHCLFVSDKKTHEQFIFKEVIIKDIYQKQWVQKLCKQKIDYVSDNMMKIKSYGFEKEKSNFKGYFLFEKPYKDLRSQSLTRHGSKMMFSDRELLIIMQGVVRALKWLKSMNHIHNSVCTTNIFISKSGTISLSDPCLNTQLNAYYRSKNRIYYSPQRLKGQKNVQDLFASDLFSLGMSIMQLIFMSSMEDIYTRYNTIDFKLLSSKTYQIRNQKLRRYIEGLLHPIEQKRVVIANQIDSQIKIVSVTLKNADFLIQKMQHSKTPSNTKSLKLFNKHLYTIQNYFSSISPLKQLQNGPLFQEIGKPNFKRKKCFSQSSINKQNYHSTFLRSNKKSSIQQITPSKQYSTFRQKNICLENSYNNYSSYKVSKVSIQPEFNSKKKIIHQLSEESFRKCRTQRNEELLNNIFTSQFKPQHFKTEVQQQYFVFNNEEYQSNPIQNNKKLNKLISPSQIFKKNKPIIQPIFLPKNQVNLKKLQQTKIQNKIKQVNVKIDTQAINTSNFIKKQSTQLNKNKSQKLKTQSIFPIIQKIDISDSIQKQIINLNNTLQKQEKTQSQQIICEFNNSKTLTFQKILSKKQEIASSLKQQTPFVKSKSRRFSLFKSQILDQQMTPKKKEHNIGNSTIKQQSESGLSSVTINCNEFVIEQMNGGRYQGEKQNGQRNGNGIFYYDDGGYYDGEWKDDCMHGLGKLYYNNEGLLAYQGEFFANQFHGKGKVFNDQMVNLQNNFNFYDFNEVEQYWFSYEGYFQCDTRNGIGKLKLTNGQIFQGQFKNDQIEGQGRFYTRNGQLILGTWKDSKLIYLND